MTDTRVNLRTKLNLTNEQLVEDRKLFKEIYQVEEVGPTEVYKANKKALPKVESFLEHLYRAGMPKTSIRNMETILEWNYEHPTTTQTPEYSEGTTTMMATPEYAAESNTLTPDQLKQFQQEAETQQAKREAAAKNAEAIVNEGIRRQQEIYDQRIKEANKAREKAAQEVKYVKEVEKPAATEELQKARDSFVEEISGVDPKVAIPVVYENLREVAPQDIPDSAVAITAVYAVASAQKGISPAARETLTETWIKENPQFTSWASPLADQSKSLHDLAEDVARKSLGPNQTLVPDYNINFSENPAPGYEETTTAFIPAQSAILAERAQTVLKSGKEVVASNILSDLEKQLIANPEIQGSSKSINKSLVQGYFTTYTTYYRPPASASTTTTDWTAKINAASGLNEVSGLVGGLAQAGIQKVATKAAGQVATKLGIKAAIQTAASSVPVIGNVLAWIATEIGEKILSKIPWDKVKKWSLMAIGAITFGAGLAFGIPGITILGLGTMGYGTASAMGVSASSIGSGIAGVAGAIGTATLGAVGPPILFTLLGFPIIVALILFIINSGAYVVPPSLSTLESNINPYMEVVVTSNPPGPFSNSNLPLKVTYTVKVIAKKTSLTGVTIKNECSAILKSGTQKCSAPDITVPNGTIGVGSPFTYTFDGDYGIAYNNALILDTITVTATAGQDGQQEATGGTSITVGNPPTGCLSIDGNWPSSYKQNMEQARAQLVGSSSSYISEVCSSFSKVSLIFDPGANDHYWGWNDLQSGGVATIHFYKLGVGNQSDALYTLSHELGHSLASGSKSAFIYAAYLSYPGIKSEAPYCFYADTIRWNAGESMPEAIALFIIQPRCGSVQQKWPIHYRFLKQYVFK